MGATTSLAAMARQPAAPVACWYSAAPVVDLVSQVETDPAVQDQILDAWGRVPGTEETPLAVVDTLPTETAYRVIAPPAGAPELLRAELRHPGLLARIIRARRHHGRP